MKPVVIIFAKAPRRAQVKSRLAQGIGEAAALAFYRATLFRLARLLGRDRRWRCVLRVTPDAMIRPARLWPRAVTRERQGRGDLGRRMARALADHAPRPCLIVGADIPGLGGAHVARAWRLLRGADLMFGPCGDGGYWTVGARRLPRDLFQDVRWSTRHALADSRRGLSRHRVALADRLDDVDDRSSYDRWRSENKG
jgi:rSAM/selenodomain-associated transferase 1